MPKFSTKGAFLNRKTWAYLLLATVLTTQLACAPQTSNKGAITGTVDPSQSSRSESLPQSPPKLDSLTLAEPFIEQAEFRLSQVPRDPEFNGYQDFVTTASTKNGLLDRFARAEKEKTAVPYQELTRHDGKAVSPLGKDLKKISRAVFKPTISATFKIPESGPVQIPNSENFLGVLRALTMVPKSESTDPNLGRRIQKYLFTLMVARKVALGATTTEHYLAAIDLQEAALNGLTTVIKTQTLETPDLRDLISSIQSNVSNELELLPLLENDYFYATRELEGLKLEPKDLAREQRGLAAHVVAIYAYASDPQPPANGFQFSEDLPELKGCVYANKQPDGLEALRRSRRGLTQLAAVEMLAALEAYKADTGSYPAALEDLVPGFVTRIPKDCLSPSGSFTYLVQNGEFKLESGGDGSEGTVVW